MNEPLMFHAAVKAEDCAQYDDMRLRMLIRRAWVDATEAQLTLDEALHILEDEVMYLQKRMKP